MRAWILAGLCACRAAPGPVDAGDTAPPVAPTTLEARAQAVLGALAARDGAALAAASGVELRVEVRDLLVETDERVAEVLTGGPAIAAFPARFLSLARFPGGLSTAGTLRCFPDCCDLTVPGVGAGVLQVRRLCFSARGPAGEPRLAYLVFTTAR